LDIDLPPPPLRPFKYPSRFSRATLQVTTVVFVDVVIGDGKLIWKRSRLMLTFEHCTKITMSWHFALVWLTIAAFVLFYLNTQETQEWGQRGIGYQEDEL